MSRRRASARDRPLLHVLSCVFGPCGVWLKLSIMFPDDAALPKLDNHHFGVGTTRAFKRLPFLAFIIAWHDVRQKHWQTASWAASLAKRRWCCRIEIMWLWHGAASRTWPVMNLG